MKRRSFIALLASIPVIGKALLAQDSSSTCQPVGDHAFTTLPPFITESNKEEFVRTGQLMGSIRTGYADVLRAQFVVMRSRYATRLACENKIVQIVEHTDRGLRVKKMYRTVSEGFYLARNSSGDMYRLLKELRSQEWDEYIAQANKDHWGAKRLIGV